MSKPVVCSICRGTGRRAGKPCPRCQGSGHLDNLGRPAPRPAQGAR